MAVVTLISGLQRMVSGDNVQSKYRTIKVVASVSCSCFQKGDAAGSRKTCIIHLAPFPGGLFLQQSKLKKNRPGKIFFLPCVLADFNSPVVLSQFYTNPVPCVSFFSCFFLVFFQLLMLHTVASHLRL